ncbi:MAG: pilus assembly protein PilP [Legionella sp.]|nr:pilus assembly protein PilP [Legionella sp.]
MFRISVALSVVLLTACTDDNQDLTQYIESVKLHKPQTEIRLPQLKPMPYVKPYLKQSSRNPFTLDNLSGSEDDANKESINEFALEELKFAGSLSMEGQIWALISLPNAKVIRLGIGDYIGRNHGRIRQITFEQIILEEKIKTAGRWVKKQVTLKLDPGK